jgi:hypothetical protein
MAASPTDRVARLADHMSADAPSQATIDEIRAADVADVAALIHTEATGAAPTPELRASLSERLRWLLADNPAQPANVPWGWLALDSSGKAVGTMVCVPQRFSHQGTELTALMSAKWFVSQEFRGVGLGIFLKYLKLGRRYPLYATTAGAQSAPLWQKFNGYAINDSDHECIGARRMAPLLEEAAIRRLKAPALARAAGALAMIVPGRLRRVKSAARGTIDPVGTAQAVIEVGAKLPSDKVTAVRDQAFLHWRHFAGPDAPGRTALAIRAPSGASVVAIVGFDARGHRQQVRTLSVMDMWGEYRPDDMPAIAGLLLRQFSLRFDMMVFRAQPPEHQEALQHVGFLRRTFDSPVAWCIDSQNCLPSRSWYLVPADYE